jgi:hypothetical protein
MRITEAFELDEDDFLEARPARFVLEGREIDPPNWALRAICKVGGKRHPKREIQYGTVYDHKYWARKESRPWGDLPGSLPIVPVGPRPNPDETELFNRKLEQRRRKQGRKAQNKVAARKAVPSGNIREEDYRFWKGSATAYMGKNLATCRWCLELCNGLEAMHQHHRKGHCKDFLMALYRFAKTSSKQRYCFSCKRETSQFRWGIPLCNATTCLARWKFNLLHTLQGLQHYRDWADEAHFRDPNKGPFKDLAAQAKTLLVNPDKDDINGVPC